MSFYDRLERKIGRHTVPNLPVYISVISLIGFLIMYIQPAFYLYNLSLNPQEIMHGQIWRILTFLFYAPSSNFILALLSIYVYYVLGMTLERVWGSFRYNVFFFQGTLLLVLSSLLIYLLSGLRLPFILFPTYMNFSIFLAYALTFPDATFYFYFLLPVKAKWLAAFELVMYSLILLTGSIPRKLEILLAIANVGLFYLLSRKRRGGKISNIRDYR